MLRKPRHLTRFLIPILLLVMGISAAAPNAAPVYALQGSTLVVIPGTIQSKAGCPADWQPDCQKTALTRDPTSGVYKGTFDLPAGKYEYKVAIGGSWAENYGQKAKKDGANIALDLSQSGAVTFYYDPATHWVTDNRNSVIATLAGTFETKLGCPVDNKPDCLKTWLEDIDGDGVYSFTTTAIPKGDYEVSVATDEGKGDTFGTDGAKGGASIKFTVANDKDEIYFEFNATKHLLKVFPGGAPRGDLSLAQAQWVSQNLILWKLKDNSDENTYTLYYDPDGKISLTPQGVVGGQTIPLQLQSLGPNLNALGVPHLKGYDTLKLANKYLDKVPEILKGQVVVSAMGKNGKLIDATSVQIWGALDAIYKYNGDLGVTYKGDAPTLRLWAPTAKSVELLLYDFTDPNEEGKATPMTFDATTGVWSAAGDASWTNKYYLYQVKVYTRTTGKVEESFVTDPYSISLSMNSTRSQIVNLNDPVLLPSGWDKVKKPELKAPEDVVIYELHVRDFSINDQTVSEPNRGTFKAFTETNSNGMKHLKALADAGLTHIHLLPVFDIATIEEDKSKWQSPDPKLLKTFAPDSDQQQAEVARTNNQDGFNWGYDPYHYTTPEGSYSTDPDSPTRIREFREMVQALNAIGLRVVMDVVYNHTSAAGQDPKSVLDKIVPDYYYRLNADGFIENSTCCANTATEHTMMEKLMLDSLHTWATAYKVDGFRFDLMGHHLLRNMVAVRQMLDSLTPDKDGVDGKAIYIYGEGWNFGEVADNARGKNATQINVAGTGIGTFNDRIRDAVRGGGPFDDQQLQGFATGLFSDPNAKEKRKPDEQKAKLLQYGDWIKVALAGNLTTYSLTDATGKTVTGDQVDYNGSPAGYTSDPQEQIAYVSAHDNQTIFDAVQLKAPASADIKARVRMNNLALDVVMLSQGVPFFHAGDDMLRSKDMDNDSYNSGDWFNALNFTYQSNNWGVGLPIADKNKANWPIMRPLLADPKLKPSKDDILFAVAHFQEMLRIRKSSALFRLQTADEVQKRVKFYNVGPDQTPGLIVEQITDAGSTQLDDKYSQIVILFNGTDKDMTYTEKAFVGLALTLHPGQAASVDPVLEGAKFDPATGMFTIPARTTGVFVLPKR